MFAWTRQSVLKALAIAALFILAATFAFYQLGVKEIESADEGIYGQVSLEMFQGGSWLEPTWYGDLWLEKPPLHFWLNQISLSIFGLNAFAIRFFPALFYLASGILMILLGYRLWKNFSGGLAFLVLTTSTLFVVDHIGRTGDFDMALVFFSLLAVYAYVRQLQQEQGKWWILAGAALAGAFWVKSVMVAPLFLTFFLHWAVSFRNKQQFIVLLKIYGASIIFILPWVLLNLAFHKQEFLTYFWGVQIRDRVGANFGNHLRPWYWYGWFFHWSLAPYFYVAGASLLNFLRKWKSLTLAEQVIPLWFLTVFIPFSVVSSKMHWHILPAVIPLLLMLAHTVWRLPKEKWYIQLLMPALLLLGYYPVVVSKGIWSFTEFKTFHFVPIVVIAGILIGGWLLYSRKNIKQHLLYGIFIAILATSIAFNIQKYQHVIFESAPSLLEQSLEPVEQGSLIYLYQFPLMQIESGAYPEPSVIFYLQVMELDYVLIDTVEELEELAEGSKVLLFGGEGEAVPSDFDIVLENAEYRLLQR